jgi:hypothetical protein
MDHVGMSLASGAMVTVGRRSMSREQHIEWALCGVLEWQRDLLDLERRQSLIGKVDA